MKSDRRRELQTNDLAEMLSHGIERYRDYWPTVAWAAVALLAAVAAFGFWGARKTSSGGVAWEEYYLANGGSDINDIASRLKQVARRYPDTDVALWARLDLADLYCFEGRRKLDTDRETGLARLREARETYSDVLHNPKMRPDMIRRAALAEAKCSELLGDRQKAIESYQNIAQNYTGAYPEIANEARSRASELEQPEAADFYKWLAQYKPAASKLTRPSLTDSLLPPIDDKDKPISSDPLTEGSEKQASEPAPHEKTDETNDVPADKDADSTPEPGGSR